jgi:hypothetical protein
MGMDCVCHEKISTVLGFLTLFCYGLGAALFLGEYTLLWALGKKSAEERDRIVESGSWIHKLKRCWRCCNRKITVRRSVSQV